MRKLCWNWVSRLLTVDQKQPHNNDSECYLQLFQCNKKEFLHKYVTMDKTWIHHFSLESNWLSADCTAAGEKTKMETSAGRVLASIFWDAQGYLEKGRTINREYYKALLVCLKEEIAKNGHKWRRKKCSFTKTIHCISLVNHNNGKTIWITLQIASAPTLFSRSGPQQLLAICRLQKNAPGKEIWLQWRSDIGNWGIFCS